jgi:hypothetical protein
MGVKRMRGSFHVLMIGALLSLAASVTAGAASPWLLLEWLVAYLGTALVLELSLKQADLRSGRVLTASDNDGVRYRIDPTSALLDSADHIDILGGTLKTFVEHKAAVAKLHDRHRANAQVRVLLMEPGSWGTQLAVEERRARGVTTPDDMFDREIIDTLRCLADEFSPRVLGQIVRLYPTSRRTSVHRYGDRYIVTVYTFGRGSSSPTLTLRRQGNEGFCESLDRGFAELWNAKTTLRLDAALLSELGIA